MQQIANWLEKLNLGQYAQRFAENDISFGILPDLTDQWSNEINKLNIKQMFARQTHLAKYILISV